MHIQPWFVVVALATHKPLVMLKDSCLPTYAHSTPSGLRLYKTITTGFTCGYSYSTPSGLVLDFREERENKILIEKQSFFNLVFHFVWVFY